MLTFLRGYGGLGWKVHNRKLNLFRGMGLRVFESDQIFRFF